MKNLLLIFGLLIGSLSFGQIPVDEDITGQLTLSSTTTGALFNRLTTAERDAISNPVESEWIYNTDDQEFQKYNGATWDAIGGGGGGNTIYTASDNLALDVDVTMNGFDLEFDGSNQSVLITSEGYITSLGPFDDPESTVYGLKAGRLLTASGIDNTFFGYEAGESTTSGDFNTFVGWLAGTKISTSSQNTALGSHALKESNLSGDNTAIGQNCLPNITGASSAENVGLGQSAGRLLNGGGNFTAGSRSIFIGVDVTANGNGETNQIAVGWNAEGQGSNSAKWGGSAILNHYFDGGVNVTGSGSTSATVTLLLENSSSTELFKIEDDGSLHAMGNQGLNETVTFGGGGSGDVATLTFTNGIVTGKTLVP